MSTGRIGLFGIFAADSMLFGGEAITGGGAIAFTIPFGIALAIPCALIQKYNYNDNWGAAIGKGLLIGVLTAIPTSLPAVIPFVGGVVGSAKLVMENKQLQ